MAATPVKVDPNKAKYGFDQSPEKEVVWKYYAMKDYATDNDNSVAHAVCQEIYEYTKYMKDGETDFKSGDQLRDARRSWASLRKFPNNLNEKDHKAIGVVLTEVEKQWEAYKSKVKGY